MVCNGCIPGPFPVGGPNETGGGGIVGYEVVNLVYNPVGSFNGGVNGSVTFTNHCNGGPTGIETEYGVLPIVSVVTTMYNGLCAPFTVIDGEEIPPNAPTCEYISCALEVVVNFGDTIPPDVCITATQVISPNGGVPQVTYNVNPTAQSDKSVTLMLNVACGSQGTLIIGGDNGLYAALECTACTP